MSSIYIVTFLRHSLDHIGYSESDSQHGVDSEKCKNLLWALPRFQVTALWKGGHKFLFSAWQIFCQKLLCHLVAINCLQRFRIVTHCKAASFSWKFVLCETNNIFYSQEYQVWHKDDIRFWKVIENELEVTLDSFRNFAYVSSYWRLNDLTWKRDYAISSKLQMPQTWPRPFWKALIKFY